MRHQIIQKTNKMVLENETTQNVSPISELQRLHRDRSVLKTNTQKRKMVSCDYGRFCKWMKTVHLNLFDKFRHTRRFSVFVWDVIYFIA